MTLTLSDIPGHTCHNAALQIKNKQTLIKIQQNVILTFIFDYNIYGYSFSNGYRKSLTLLMEICLKNFCNLLAEKIIQLAKRFRPLSHPQCFFVPFNNKFIMRELEINIYKLKDITPLQFKKDMNILVGN